VQIFINNNNPNIQNTLDSGHTQTRLAQSKMKILS